MIELKPYKKPTIIGYNATRGIIPLAVFGAVTSIAPIIGGFAAGALAASTGAAGVGFGAAAAAAAAGAAAGAAATKLAGKITLDEPILALTARKDFALE